MLLMVQAMEAEVGDPLSRLVLVRLAYHANDDGECWPSYKHLSDQCDIGKSTVVKHIKHLEKAGLLKIENRKGPKGNTSNKYKLTLPSLQNDGTPISRDDTPLYQEVVHPMPHGDTPIPRDDTPPISRGDTRTSHSFEPVIEQVKEPVEFPREINKEAWLEFVEHRKGKKKAVSEQAKARLFNKLKTLSFEEQQEAIDRSIESGWTGIFPDKKGESNGASGSKAISSRVTGAAGRSEAYNERIERLTNKMG